MPVIGVAASDADWARTYREAAERGGMETRLLLPNDPARVQETLNSLDGILLTGGADIDPATTTRHRTLPRGWMNPITHKTGGR